MLNPFYLIFVWVLLFMLFEYYIKIRVPVFENPDESFSTVSLAECVISIIPIMLVAVFMKPQGDVYAYIKGYQRISPSIQNIIETIKIHESGFGFDLFSLLLKGLFGNDVLIFRGAVFLLHSTVFLVFFRKYSINYGLSLYLFLAVGCHMAWLMNGLRQFMAVAITLFSVPYVLKKEILRPILIILLAVAFHTSAIVMLPIIFTARGKAWNRKTQVIILLCIIFAYLFSVYSGLLDTMLAGTEYSGLMENAINNGDDGTNPIRVLVASVPCIIAFIGRKQLEDTNNEFINYCVNMSIATSGLYIISMVTSGIMLGRLPIYTNIFNFVLLPYEITVIFEERYARMLTVFMMVLYFAYYLYGYGRVS